MTIYQADAFADRIFKGNPAAVIPLESWIADELMQQIAMENNLSETVFFVRSSSLSSGERRGEAGTGEDWEGAIRWFTPDYEIDLCGHATLAAAFIIKKHLAPSVEVVNFTTQKAGALRVICKDDFYTLDFPSRMPLPCEVPQQLFAALGIGDAVEVLKSRDYFVVLENEEAVKKVEPDFILMKKLNTIGVIVTAKGDSADVVSRCFYPGAGIPEDPVTGSAHCNIIPYWCGKLGINKFFAKQLSKRGGDIWCELKGERVLIGGRAVEYMKGVVLT